MKISKIIFQIVFISVCSAVLAWNDYDTHSAINTKAFDYFAENDGSHVATSRSGKFSRSSGQPVSYLGMGQTPEFNLWFSRTMKEWIQHGGYSADSQPFFIPFEIIVPLVGANSKQLYMPLRHFFDPVSQKKYLSDLLIVQSVNPGIDHVWWAIDHPDHVYSWTNGLRFFRAALNNTPGEFASLGGKITPTPGALPSRENLFAAAFRAVGETMHGIGDMALPGHVRNDSHSGQLYGLADGTDPVEEVIRYQEVQDILGSPPRVKIPSDFVFRSVDPLPDEIMKAIAGYTNSHFFSENTITEPDWSVYPENLETPYSAPRLKNMVSCGNVYYSDIPGFGLIPQAQKTLLSFGITSSIARKQAEILLPLAVYGCAEALDRFFPNLTMMCDPPRDTGQGLFSVSGRLLHGSDPAYAGIGSITYSGPGEIRKNGEVIEDVVFTNGEMSSTSGVGLVNGDRLELAVVIGGWEYTSQPYFVSGLGPTLPTPTISSISPISGKAGAIVLIQGANFGGSQGNSQVLLNDVPMAAVTWSPTEIKVQVPSTGISGNIRVIVGGNSSGNGAFSVSAPVNTSPLISNVVISSLGSTSATISWSTDRASFGQLRFGQSFPFSSTTNWESASSLSHQARLSGLVPGTTYFFQVASKDIDGNLGTLSSTDQTFLTTSDNAPNLSAIQTIFVRWNDARFYWGTNISANEQMEYGLAASYGQQTTASTNLSKSHYCVISGLVPGTTYHARARSSDGAGHQTVSGDFVFSTPSGISQVSATPQSSTSEEITWSTGLVSTTQVEYGTTTAYGNVTLLATTPVSLHRVSVDGLSTGMLYHYRVRSKDLSGTELVSGDFTFQAGGGSLLTPKNLQAVAGDGMVNLTWDPVSGVDSYTLYWSEVSGSGKNSTGKFIGATSPFPKFDLINGVTYYFIVTSTKSGVESEASAEVSARPTQGPLAIQPQRIAAGFTHSLALKNDGTLWTWGSNFQGQLQGGLSHASLFLSPILSSSSSAKSGLVAYQEYSASLNSDGTISVWGTVGGVEQAIAAIPGFSDVVSISGSLALRKDGTVWQWVNSGVISPVQVNGLAEIKAISATAHYLALRQDGKVYSWGNNSYGQLGDGTRISRSTPSIISGLPLISSIAAGSEFSIAAARDGSVYTWGLNNSGQLGTGDTQYRTSPGAISGLANAVAVAAGEVHSLALTVDRNVYSWGYGPLIGNGGATDQLLPTRIQSLSNIESVSCGNRHSLAQDFNGIVYSWGNNGSGQLGDGTTTARTNPVRVTLAVGPSGVNAESGDGKTTITWNSAPGATSFHLYWSNVADMSPSSFSGEISNVTSPQVHSGLMNGTTYFYILTAISPEGTVPTGVFSATPQPAPNQPPVCSLSLPAAGARFNPGSNIILAADAADNDGSIARVDFYDGSNKIGEDIYPPYSTTWNSVPVGSYSITAIAYDNLGGFKVSSPRTISVSPPSQIEVTGFSGGGFHSLAMQNDGSVWVWGAGSAGQLGDGTNVSYRMTPSKITFAGVERTVAGYNFSLARKDDGTVFSWGSNGSGCLGDGTTTSSNFPIPILSGINSISAGYSSAFAVQSDGTVLGWGNSAFLTGREATATVSLPTSVVGLSNILSVAVGDAHFLALDNNGYVWAWGNGYNGQLGDGGPLETLGLLPPAKIPTLSAIRAVGAGYNNSYALDATGNVWTWGQNQNGQLGNGTTIGNSIPTKVAGVSGVVAIAGGQGHILALKSNGTIVAWGQNGAGQVGNNTATNCLSPVTIGLTNVVYIGAGRQHSMAITSDRKVWTWGYNGFAQLGNNSFTNSPVPVEVSF